MEDETHSGWMPAGLQDEVRRAASLLRRADSVRIISHVDTDGITAGAIASATVDRLGKHFSLNFEKEMSLETILEIGTCTEDVVWICDLGSACMPLSGRDGIIVTDHHVDLWWLPERGSGQSPLNSSHDSYLINPYPYGPCEVCGAGMTYLLSKAVDPKNVDLAYLAVVGAVGDLQDKRDGRLVSWNREILADAVSCGDISVERDIRYFGRESYPVARFLEYGKDPRADGISNDRAGCLALLNRYGIRETDDGGCRRTWVDLDPAERAVLVDAVCERIPSEADRARLIGEVYLINRYGVHSDLHDVKEFSALLNSCGRYDDARTGSRLCMGDMKALPDAKRYRRESRKDISVALRTVKDKHLLRRRKYLQFFDAGTEIRETIVGIVAGMVLDDFKEADHGLPMIAFATADDGIKVSARASRALISKGLDLQWLMRDAAASVGGWGEGPAGTTIPKGSQEKFLDKVGEILSSSAVFRS